MSRCKMIYITAATLARFEQKASMRSGKELDDMLRQGWVLSGIDLFFEDTFLVDTFSRAHAGQYGRCHAPN